MLKYIWKNKILLILLILGLWLIPKVIGLSEQSRTESIVTAIGIDKNNEEYEVSLQYIVPSTTDGPEGLKINTQKANSVGEAIEKIKLQLGKISGFAHCRFLVFSDSACEEDFTQLLDFLLRRKTNTNNIVLVNTPDSSKELLSISNKLDSDLYSFLDNNSSENEFGDFHDLKTIGDYYNVYFSPVKCLLVNRVKLKSVSDNTSSSDQSSNSGSGENGQEQSSSQNGNQEKKEFENKGEQIVLKDNKKLITLSEQESDDLSWFNPDIKRDQFIIKNYSENNLKNASILFNVLNKKLYKKAYFKDGKPNFDITLRLYIRTGEIVGDNVGKRDYEVLQRYLSDKLKRAMREVILSSLKNAENNFKLNNYDVIECYNNFYKFKNKELKKYLEKNPQAKQNFINEVKFNYNIEFVQGH